MTGNFRSILAGIGMRAFENRHQHLIQNPFILGDNSAKMRRVALLVFQLLSFKNRIGQPNSKRSRKPYDADRTHARGSGQGDNGSGKIRQEHGGGYLVKWGFGYLLWRSLALVFPNVK